MSKNFVCQFIAVKFALCVALIAVGGKAEAEISVGCFETQYIVDESFAAGFSLY